MNLQADQVRDDLERAGLLREARGVTTSSGRLFAGIVTDSRLGVTDQLFVALRGDRLDGHAFVAEALSRGAAGVVIDDATSIGGVADGVSDDKAVYLVTDTLAALQALAQASLRHVPVRVVAITGSNGKTTTKDLTAAAVRTLGPTAATSGNRNNHIGVPLTVLERDEKARYLVTEVGANHFGEIDPLSRLLRPQVAVVTNIGHAHLEAFGDLDGVARAKAEIFAGLGDDGIAVLNADDPRTPALRTQLGKRRSVSFGFDAKADYRVEVVNEVGDGQQLAIGGVSFTLRRPGRANAANAAAAFAVACELGAAREQVVRALEATRFTAQRSCWVRIGAVDVLDDTYNANPDSMRQALEMLAQRSARRVAVLGDMLELGPQAEALHADLGRVASRAGVAVLFTIGEFMAAAGREARATGVRLVRHFETMEALLEAVRDEIRPGDVVLVKGSRGLQMERVVSALRVTVA